MKYRIFIDLDQCIIHSLYAPSDDVVENFRQRYRDFPYIDFEVWGDRFVTFLRPVAHQLISECKNLVGDEGVYICTASVIDYAAQIIELHDLDIDISKCYAREDMLSGEVEEFKESTNILIDDNDFYFHIFNHHSPKVKFLNLTEDNLIQIKEFDVAFKHDYLGGKDEEVLLNVLEELKNKI